MSTKEFYIPLIELNGKIFPWVEMREDAAITGLKALPLKGKARLFKVKFREGKLFVERINHKGGEK